MVARARCRRFDRDSGKLGWPFVDIRGYSFLKVRALEACFHET